MMTFDNNGRDQQKGHSSVLSHLASFGDEAAHTTTSHHPCLIQMQTLIRLLTPFCNNTTILMQHQGRMRKLHPLSTRYSAFALSRLALARAAASAAARATVLRNRDFGDGVHDVALDSLVRSMS